MAKFKPYKILESQLDSLPIQEGQFILTTDTNKLYSDTAANTRILISPDAITDLSVNGTTITYTRLDGTTGTITTKDTTYSVASTTKNGLMSASDKEKLDAIEKGAQVNTITGVKGDSESLYRTGNVNITKANIGLNNVENKSSATIRGELTNSNVTTALGYTPLNSSLKGANSGLAELDASGKVPASQLPSYVDDVLEYSAKASFPTTGETGKIYVDTSTNKTYRWGGSAYTEISPSIALGTTSSTAFRGDYGQAAYTHAVTNKGAAFGSGFYKITTNAEGHVTGATAVAKSDITALGIPAQDTTYSAATTSAAGLMSSADKTKLDGIAAGAQKNTITGVKGNSESTYRTGNVNITKDNIGLGNIDNTADSNKSVKSAGQLTTARNINGVAFDGTKDITITANPTTTILTNEDLNNISTPGLYNAAGNNTTSNRPSDVAIDAYGLFVYKTAGGYITQELTCGNTNPMLKYIRHFNSVAWSNWVQMKYTDTTYTGANGVTISGTTISNSGVRSIAIGTSNGTISVNTNGTAANVAVKGLANAAYKNVDTTIGAASTSANLPTSAAVASFVEGKGYKTTDNNTTYTFATGDANGQIKVTPSGGSAQNVNVKGLGSLAYKSSLTASEVGAIASSLKGAANGVAELDSNGKVPSAQLPSYVDDVIEGYYYNNKFYKESGHTTEITGESGKIYVDLSTNKTYRWSGSAYAVISDTLALGTTSSTAYRGDYGNTAYQHSQKTSGNPHKVTKSDVGLGNVNNTADADKSVKYATTAGDATTVSGHTVAKDVPSNAVFTDTNTWVKVSTTADGYISKLSGNTSQYLRGDGTWAIPPNTNTTYTLTQDSTDGHRITLTPSSGAATTITIPDNNTTYTFSNGLSASGTSVSNSGVRSVATGAANGTLSVNTNGNTSDIAVKGLAAAAYKGVDTSLTSGSTSTNLPTSKAVADLFATISSQVGGMSTVATSLTCTLPDNL